MESHSLHLYLLVGGMLGAGRPGGGSRFIFGKILGYGNHPGCIWRIDLPGKALGNFPQAFTHLGLIRAATQDSAINKGRVNSTQQAP